MKSKLLSFILLLVAASLAIGCTHGGDIRTSLGEINQAEIKYVFKVSPEMLYYFDFTASYTTPDSVRRAVKMTTDSLVIHTSTSSFPSERSLTFDVTRRNVPNPTVAPEWETSLTVTVDRYFTNQTEPNILQRGTIETFSPSVADFDTWAEEFITRMALGYPMFIVFTGDVNTSF